jgi:hypothetical protein
MLFLVLQKRWKRWVCWDRTLPDTPLDSDTDLAVPFDDDLTEEEEQTAGTCRLCEDHNRAEWIRCTKCLRWGKNFVLVCRKILFVPLVRDKHRFVRSLYPLISNFLNSVTIPCAVCFSYSPPQIINTCVPN